MTVRDLVRFHGNRLFAGAIDLDWYFTKDENWNEKVAEAYLFHGPHYLTAHSSDVGKVKTHSLTDTVTLVDEVLNSLLGETQLSFAIAGYGTGKSHFSLTLAELLTTHNTVFKQTILSHIREQDQQLYDDIVEKLNKLNKPVLVVPVNGIRSVNLFQEIFTNAKKAIEKDPRELSLSAFERFNPQYASLLNLLSNHFDKNLVSNVLHKAGFASFQDFKISMDSFDNEAYARAKDAWIAAGQKYYEPVASGQIKDFLPTLSRAYCGEGKPFSAVLLLFDEFGRYMVFSAENAGKAGTSALQDLYEGIVGVPNISMLGLSQLDLSEYVRTVQKYAPQLVVDDLNRYVTRFAQAKRYFLSLSFESLLASLLETPNPTVNVNYETTTQQNIELNVLTKIFPAISINPIWNNRESFKKNVLDGCWPLSPYTTYLLTYLCSQNNLLFTRSAFEILHAALGAMADNTVDRADYFLVYPCDLFEYGLKDQLLESEGSGMSALTCANDYEKVLAKYGQKLSYEQIRVLQAVVLCEVLHVNSENKFCTQNLLSRLTGFPESKSNSVVSSLCGGDFDILQLNNVTNLFQIRTGGLSYQDFQSKLNEKIKNLTVNAQTLADAYFPDFINKDVLSEIVGQFAGRNTVSATEFSYEPSYCSLTDLSIEIRKRAKAFASLTAPNVRKGKVFYTYVPLGMDLSELKNNIHKELVVASATARIPVCPILVVFLYEDEMVVPSLLSRKKAMEYFTTEEQKQFGHYLADEKQKTDESLRVAVKKMAVAKNVASALEISSYGEPLRASVIGDKVFETLYPTIIPFNWDGLSYGTKGLSSCRDFINIFTSLDTSWNAFTTLPIAETNAARSIFMHQEGWQVFLSEGALATVPGNAHLSNLFATYDELVQSGKEPSLAAFSTIAETPPYGANAVVAAVLGFLFYAMHSNDYGLSKEGKVIPSNLSLIDKKFLTKDGLSDAMLSITFFVKRKQSTKWDDFFKRCKEVQTYEGVISLDEERKWLEENHYVLPARLKFAYQEFLKRVEDAKALLSKFADVTSKYRERLDNPENYAQNVVKGTITFRTYVRDTIKPNANRWTKGQHDQIKALFDRGKESVVENFNVWKSRNPLKVNASDGAFVAMSNKYKNLAVLLNHLADGKPLAEELDALVQQREPLHKSFIEYSAFLNVVKQEFSAMSYQVQHPEKVSFIDLVQSEKNCESLLDRLSNYDTTKLVVAGLADETMADSIRSAKRVLENRVHELDESLSNVFATRVTTAEGLYQLQNQVRLLLAPFEESDKEDALKRIVRDIEELVNVNRRMEDTPSLRGLNQIRNNALLQYSEHPDGIFDAQAIIEMFYQNSLAVFQNKSSKWTSDVTQQINQIQTISDALRIKESLEAYPGFLLPDDVVVVRENIKKLDKFISANRVNALIEQFKSLSAKEQQEFLSNIKEDRSPMKFLKILKRD